MKGRDFIGSDEPLRRPRVYYVTLETWSNSCWQCFTQSADICALLSLTALDSSGVKYYCIYVSTWKRTTAVTGFLDCDRNLDICSSVMTDFQGSDYLYWGEPSEEAKKHYANWIFVANFHCHLTSGSLKCHLQQGLWPIVLLDSNLEMHHRLEGTIDAKIAFLSLHWGAGEFFSLMRIWCANAGA